ncbi:MAG: hypothetical protein D6772_01040 [Bacteroidetes bacterium]|nr:MAG: hypothetical protein D6772_01040 [Bacteroidota bacterium]
MKTETGGNKAFDRMVQEKLQELHPTYRPDSWERLATRLDAEEGASDFDAAIAQGLGQFSVPYQPESWDKLAARLDAQEAIEAFDEQVAQQVKRVTLVYRSSSWEALAARLELERQRIRAVLHYKTMELTLLLLLFLTAWQHLPLDQPSYPSKRQGVDYPIASTQGVDQTAQEAAAIMPPRSNTRIAAAPHDQQFTPELTEPLPLSRAELSTITSGLRTDRRQLIGPIPKAIPEVNPLPNQQPDLLPNRSGPQQRLAALRAQKAAAVNSPADPFLAFGSMTALTAEAPALLDYGQPEELLRYIRPSERKTFVRVGFLGAPDYNRIVTPPQRIEDGSIYTSTRYALGYSGGISIGVEHNERWEVETGLIYAARRYQAIPTVFVTGSVQEGFSGYSLQDFELNTFSAPLNFRYNFLVHNKWRIYTQLGAALNIVAQANYYAVNERAFRSLARASGLDPGNGVSSATKPDILKRKSFNDGWLDGGNFWENATLYGDLGLGVERYMTSDWGLFVQPHYQYALPFFNDGLGPYEDKIHNFSIRMGLKVRL